MIADYGKFTIHRHHPEDSTKIVTMKLSEDELEKCERQEKLTKTLENYDNYILSTTKEIPFTSYPPKKRIYGQKGEKRIKEVRNIAYDEEIGRAHV